MRRFWILSFAVLGLSVLPARADDVTYTKHVAPILFKHCANCHRPGEVGPFSLLTYKDAAKRSGFIKEVTSDKRMPPWKAESGFGVFHGARVLSTDELKTLARWADAGAPEGDPKDLPATPKFVDGWQHGEPDLVLTMPKEFKVRAGGGDVYRTFAIEIPIDGDKTVSAVEFRPGNRRVVHHALMFLDSNHAARKKDGKEKDGQPGYTTYGGIGILPTGGLGGWAPGASARVFAEGTGLYLKKGSDLVLNLHYHPSGKEELDRSSVGIYFAKKPAEKYVSGIALRSRDLNIPPGEKRYVVKTQSSPLPADAEILAITPHMHCIGREMKVVAETPDGKSIPMIWIKDWDFNWQGAYQYEKPVRVPKGTVFKLEAAYDNSSDNARNPSSPPKRVRWGEQTTDEMCLCGLSLTADSNADLRKIMSSNSALLGAILGGGAIPSDAPAAGPPVKIPPDGIAIPEQFKGLLGRYDTNGDGKLSQQEIDAMPAVLRDRVYAYIREREKK